MNIQSEIERFILDELLMGSRPNLDPEEPLFSSGIVDSLGTLRLITFLEERFAVKVGDGEVVDENFKSVSRIRDFVERRLAETPPAR